MWLLDDTIKFLLCFATSLERALQIPQASLALGQSSPGFTTWWEVGSWYLPVARSLFGNGEMRGCPKAKLDGACADPHHPNGASGADTILPAAIFSLLPLGNHSPQLLFCMVWRWLTRSRMGVCQVQSVRASHCPGHREWMKNALMTQSEWRRLAGTLAKTSKSVYTWEDLKPGR